MAVLTLRRLSADGLAAELRYPRAAGRPFVMIELAAVAGAAGALLALIPRSRVALVGGLAALALAEGLLASDLVPGGLASSLASTAGVVAGAAGLAVLAALTAMLVRFPGAVTPLVLGAAPFGVPFEFDAENRFFIGLGGRGELGRLLPLYAVLTATALALAYRALRGSPPSLLPRPVAVPAGLFIALTILSLLWAHDPAAAEDRLLFFVLPAAVLLAAVARAPFRPWLPRVLAIEAVALASLFAVVGIIEALTHRLLFYDPKIAVANSYTSYFRVTSLFSDPSIYGRHLVIGMAVVLVLVWLARIRLAAGAALLALLWTGLFFSYSQSSMAALAAATILVWFLTAERRTRRLVAAAASALVLLGAVFFAALVADESAARVTSGRSTLVGDTLLVFRNHPLAGVGVASQPLASRDEAGGADDPARHVSHTAPLTVAAELGVVGLALYAALLVGAVRTFSAVRRAHEALGLALLAVAVGLFVHSLVYGVFFEDPITWGVVAVAAAFVASEERGAARAPRDRRQAPPARAPVTAPP